MEYNMDWIIRLEIVGMLEWEDLEIWLLMFVSENLDNYTECQLTVILEKINIWFLNSLKFFKFLLDFLDF